MRVIFPNPYGHALPPKEQVLRLQEQHHFSDDYADFLLKQNGFSFAKMGASENPRQFIGSIEADLGTESELKCLFGLTDTHGESLEHHLDALSMFRSVFLPIGEGYSGDDYVEVLKGKFKGYVASLDHKMYASCSDLAEFLDVVGKPELSSVPAEALADALTDTGVGLVSLHATSVREFLSNCVHCNEKYVGYVLDSKSLGSESWGLFS